MTTTRPVKKPTVFASVQKYADPTHGWIYKIPIATNMHPRYGRMEVRLEPIIKRGRIERIYLGFRQHGIAELIEPFEILTPQADRGTGIMTHGHLKGVASFYGEAWMVQPCDEHRGSLQICSYVPDGTTALEISLLTTAITVSYLLGENL